MRERYSLSCLCGEDISVGAYVREYPDLKGNPVLLVEISDIHSTCECEPDEPDLEAQILEELEWHTPSDDNDAAFEDWAQNPEDYGRVYQ